MAFEIKRSYLSSEYDSYIFVADLHSITVPQDKDTLAKKCRDLIALYLACGIDPNKNTIFFYLEILNT